MKLFKIAFLAAFSFCLFSCEEDDPCPPRGPVWEFEFVLVNNSGQNIRIVTDADDISHADMIVADPPIVSDETRCSYVDPDYGYVFPVYTELKDGEKYCWNRRSYSSIVYPLKSRPFGKEGLIVYYFEQGDKIVFIPEGSHPYCINSFPHFKVEERSGHVKECVFEITDEMYQYAIMLQEQDLIYAGCEDPDYKLPSQYWRFDMEIRNPTSHDIRIEVSDPQWVFADYLPLEIYMSGGEVRAWRNNAEPQWTPSKYLSFPMTTIEYIFEDGHRIVFIAYYTHPYSISTKDAYVSTEIVKGKFHNVFEFTEDIYEYAVWLNEQDLIYAGSEDPYFRYPQEKVLDWQGIFAPK